MNWADHKKRIRRFLRDPDAKIWSDALLIMLFNDSQRMLQQQLLLLENVEALRVPPFFNCSYMFDWEYEYIDSPDEGRNYQFFKVNQQTGTCFSYNWESSYDIGMDISISDTGHQFMHPWEASIDGVSPGTPVPVWFPDDFESAKIIAWDRKIIEYKSIKEIQSSDKSWMTHKGGEPFYYYRSNEVDNCFVLYPFPSSIVWDDYTETSTSDWEYVYMHDWEYDEAYISGVGSQTFITTNYGGEDYAHTHYWESEILEGSSADSQDTVSTKGMYMWESEISNVGYIAIVGDITESAVEGEGTGGVVIYDGEMPSSNDGIAIDYISDEDNVLVIYKQSPADIENDYSESPFTQYLTKYIEYDTLARAYGVNNDGRIESLKQYWEFRQKMGIKVLQRYKTKRHVDRDYRLTTKGAVGRQILSKPRLPDTYPSI